MVEIYMNYLWEKIYAHELKYLKECTTIIYHNLVYYEKRLHHFYK